MIHTKSLRVPIYNTALRIIIADTHEEVCRRFKFNFLEAAKTTWAYVFEEDGGRVNLVITDLSGLKVEERYGILAHEGVHIKNAIFNRKDIRTDYSNDEPEAYLSGWLHEKIVEYYHKVLG